MRAEQYEETQMTPAIASTAQMRPRGDRFPLKVAPQCCGHLSSSLSFFGGRHRQGAPGSSIAVAPLPTHGLMSRRRRHREPASGRAFAAARRCAHIEPRASVRQRPVSGAELSFDTAKIFWEAKQ